MSISFCINTFFSKVMFCLFELLRCNSILDLYKNPKTEFQISIWVFLIVLHDKNDFEHPIFRRRHWWSTLGFNGYVAHGKLGLQTISQCLHEPQLLVEGNYRYYMRLKQSKLIHKVHSSVYNTAEYSKSLLLCTDRILCILRAGHCK